MARPRPLRALGRPRRRCCSTRCCTSPATTCRSTTSRASASGARITPGHPERDVTSRRASRSTTGPLGQGFGNAVGMAIAERFLRERLRRATVCDHHIFAICSDGDLMEGVASEAASLAGHLRLGRLVYLYDDNEITIDGPTSRSSKRGRDEPLRGVRLARRSRSRTATTSRRSRPRSAPACARSERPSLIRLQHVDRLRLAEQRRHAERARRPAAATTRCARRRRRSAGTRTRSSSSPTRSTSTGASAAARRALRRPSGRSASTPGATRSRSSPPSGTTPGPGEPPRRLRRGAAGRSSRTRLATRASPAKVDAAFAPFVPTMVGGAADLVDSTFTEFPGGERDFTPRAARAGTSHWGVREHGDGRGRERPRAARRHRAAVRLDVLRLHRLHAPADPALGADEARRRRGSSPTTRSAVGEDGPTHQPVEHLAAMRAIPKLTVIRPADANETAEAWRVILEELDGPAGLVLSRQDVPVLDRTSRRGAGLRSGAYVLADADAPDVVARRRPAPRSATRSRRATCSRAGRPGARRLDAELGALRGAGRRLPRVGAAARRCRRSRSRPASTFGWARWVDASVGDRPLRRLGAGRRVCSRSSASPPARAAERVRALLG